MNIWAWCANGRNAAWRALFEQLFEALPDFVKLAEAYGATGIRAEKPDELDDAIRKMMKTKGPVIFDCIVTKEKTASR